MNPFTNTQQLPVQAVFRYAGTNGQPGEIVPESALVGGASSWTVSDTSIATVQPSDDGLSAKVLSVGPNGTFTITLTYITPDGQTTLTGTAEAEVVDSVLVISSLELTVGAPEPKPPQPPEIAASRLRSQGRR